MIERERVRERDREITLYIYMTREGVMREREEMFFYYLTMHSTHFIYGYMASDIWYRTTQIGNPLPPFSLLFLVISSTGSFICIIPQTA